MSGIVIDELSVMRTYFRSKAAMICFALNHTDCELRAKILDIDKSLYNDKDKASLWYNKRYQEIAQSNQDVLESERVNALAKLVSIYKRMVED